MRITFLSYQYPPEFHWGGAVYAFKLTNELERQGIEVNRITHQDIPSKNFAEFAYKASKRVKDSDLVHGNIFSEMFVKGKPVVSTLHHPIKYDHPDNIVERILYEKIERTCFEKAKAVITDSMRSASEFAKIYQSQKVYSVPLGIDPVENAKFGDPKQVLCATGAGPRKGIELINSIAEEIPEIHFFITGNGTSTENIHFVGNISWESLKFLYERCGICLVPSIFEGFGLPILEAMARKKVIISTDVGVASEAITNGENGFILQRDSAVFASVIRTLINDTNLFKKIARKGYETSKQYTWKTTAEETIKIYEHVLNNEGVE